MYTRYNYERESDWKWAFFPALASEQAEHTTPPAHNCSNSSKNNFDQKNSFTQTQKQLFIRFLKTVKGKPGLTKHT